MIVRRFVRFGSFRSLFDLCPTGCEGCRPLEAVRFLSIPLLSCTGRLSSLRTADTRSDWPANRAAVLRSEWPATRGRRSGAAQRNQLSGRPAPAERPTACRGEPSISSTDLSDRFSELRVGQNYTHRDQRRSPTPFGAHRSEHRAEPPQM